MNSAGAVHCRASGGGCLGRGRRVAVLLGCLGLPLVPWPDGQARAVEVWADDTGDHVLEAGGFVKSQSIGLWFRDIDLMTGQASAESAGNQTLRLRIFADLFLGPVRCSVAEETRYVVDSPGMANLGTLPGFGSTTGNRPRLFEFPGYADAGVRVDNDLDRLFVKIAVGPADITIGRQAISWGSAWFWKPSDRFSPFSPMDVDPEVKRGVDAARAELYFGPMTSLDLVTTFEWHEESEAADRPLWVSSGARFRTAVGSYDLALSLARFQYADEGDWMIGLEAVGSVGPVGLRGETTLNMMEHSRDWDVEAVLGADYRFLFKLHVAGEAFYNGYGASDPAAYLEILTDPDKGERLARGEIFNVGRYYLGLAFAQEIHPLLSVTLSAIGNLGDPSGLLIVGAQWLPAQNGRVTLGTMLPFGKAPDGEALQSEFGAMPLAGYAVFKIAF